MNQEATTYDETFIRACLDVEKVDPSGRVRFHKQLLLPDETAWYPRESTDFIGPGTVLYVWDLRRDKFYAGLIESV